MSPNIYNKSGELSAYGLACGYVESHRTGKRWVKLYMEHAHYHIMSGKADHGYDVWEVFTYYELTKARALYRKLKKQSK
jgi:phage terminase Nu1 subunit (DNA packaging protein)